MIAESKSFSEQAIREARARLTLQGLTVEAFASNHGFKAKTVYNVLSGKRRCIRGEMLRISIALGLRASPDPASETAEFPVSAGRTVGGGAPIVSCDRSALSHAEKAA